MFSLQVQVALLQTTAPLQTMAPLLQIMAQARVWAQATFQALGLEEELEELALGGREDA